MTLVKVTKVGAHVRRHHTVDEKRGHLDNGDRGAELGRARRHFKADVTAADDQDVAARRDVLADRQGIGDIAEVVNAGKIAAG